MKVIGLMSGTSGDGIDAALVDIRGQGPSLRVRLISHVTVPYPPALSRRLLAVASSGTVTDMCHLNAVVGELFGKAALRVMQHARVSPQAVKLIGSHGQTVHHLPDARIEPGVGRIRSTLQIGEPAVIAERTGVTTVANFRPRDLAVGGQGAPLAPYAHYVLFRHPKRARLIVNLGGIANVTYLPARGSLRTIRAFDTGPANMVLDALVRHYSRGRESMDRDGRRAGRGTADVRLLAKLTAYPFFRRRPPKSTGREDFGEAFVLRVLAEARQRGVKPDHVLATCARLTAWSIADATRWIPGQVEQVIVAGGGARNRTLIRDLREEFAPTPVCTLEDLGWQSKSLEAVAFALLAYETWHGRCANVPSVTGAKAPVVLGLLAPGRHRNSMNPSAGRRR